MKILKRLAIVVVVLVVLFVAAGFIAAQFINKELVERQVSAATGREFKIDGELKPVISLSPSVRAEKVSLSNAKWGSGPQLASIGKFDIQVKLMPLLQKKIVVDKIVIDSADILLEQNKDGQWNFAFDKPGDKPANKDKAEESSDGKKLSFDISDVNITNSKLTVKQGSTPMVISIKELKLAPKDKVVALNFDGVVNNKPLKITVDLPPVADLMGGAKKVSVSNLNVIFDDIILKANAELDNDTKKVAINSLDFTKGDISINAKGWADINSKKVELVSFNGKKGNIGVTGHVVADLNAKRVDITNLAASQGDMKVNGSLSADISGAKPYIKGAINADSINLNPPGKDGKPAAAGTAEAKSSKSSGDEKLPLDGLDAANADVKITIGHLVSGDIILDKIVAVIKLNNGVLIINPMSAAFANGQIDSSITLSKSGARVNIKGANLLMEKILQETAGFNDFKNGPTNIDVSLAGSGNSVNSLINSLSGNSKISMKGATYSGEILKGRATQLTSLLTGNTSRTIEINCAVTDINWASGIGTLAQMGVDTKTANLTGSGVIKLPGHGLDLILSPVSKLANFNNLAIPVAVKGTFENPQVSTTKIVGKVAETVGKNVLQGLIESKQSGKKFKLNNALGIDKNATVASPCGAAPATVTPAASDAAAAPATANGAAATAPAATAPAADQAPTAPLSKQEQKKQKQQQKIEAIGSGLKQLGF